MNQYQRMVSYLYEYKQGVKGANVGYVRIEQRGGACRISLQVRSRNLGQLPDAAVFRQTERGIQTFTVCPLVERNGDFRCRIETESDNILDSGISLSEVDGIILYQDADYYIATTWKNAGIRIGEIQAWNFTQTREDAADGAEQENSEQGGLSTGDSAQNVSEASGALTDGAGAAAAGAQPVKSKDSAESMDITESKDARKSMEEAASEPALHTTEQEREAAEMESQRQKELKAVCGNCPFQRGSGSYGKRILAAFPTMRPFPNAAGIACVRIEPQDLGCLPMRLWHLANNHFLLQGYYCYRHLIFMENEKHHYVLGVPGIYGERDRRQAEVFGFPQFRPLCSGKCHTGAFGYWLMPLSL